MSSIWNLQPWKELGGPYLKLKVGVGIIVFNMESATLEAAWLGRRSSQLAVCILFDAVKMLPFAVLGFVMRPLQLKGFTSVGSKKALTAVETSTSEDQDTTCYPSFKGNNLWCNILLCCLLFQEPICLHCPFFN